MPSGKIEHGLEGFVTREFCPVLKGQCVMAAFSMGVCCDSEIQFAKIWLVAPQAILILMEHLLQIPLQEILQSFLRNDKPATDYERPAGFLLPVACAKIFAMTWRLDRHLNDEAIHAPVTL